ncbi:GNAT family N-acetyltransferase [Allomuricauda sp. R78024]|uniref:GNAT family N-acetyltransferase n=1 Tax=Allomuricauda sp. R78024 TaxID=3093867 RepID=UPI0037C55473
MENRHPFFGENFISSWTQHFSKNATSSSFKFINPLRFINGKLSFFYYNVGKNITNGTFYDINKEKTDYKGKTFLIYDVLSDRIRKGIKSDSNLKIRIVPQYKGYLSNLTDFNCFEDYFSKQFSSKSRTNLRKYLKRLDGNFSTSFKVFHGTISVEEYEFHFEKLIELIGKRFGELGLENNILKLRNYYKDLCYQMILNKEASLNVIYSDKEPIAISFCFLSDERAYFAITTFDTDFRRYNLGHVLIIKIMGWCFENGIRKFDYSKGTYDYKTRWANESYYFENHILYDRNSIKAALLGNYLYGYFKFKQFLRDKNINKVYSRIKFYLGKKEDKENDKFEVSELDLANFNKENLNRVFLIEETHHKLRSIIYDLLFSKPQPIKNVIVYQHKTENYYVIQGESLLHKIVLD